MIYTLRGNRHRRQLESSHVYSSVKISPLVLAGSLLGLAGLLCTGDVGADTPITVACTGNAATDAVALSNAIDTANAEGAGGGATTITLSAGCTSYSFTSSNEVGAADPTRFNWYGPNALPAIASNITIVGNGATIARSASATSNFRLFYVAPANAAGGPNYGYTTAAPAGVTPTLTLQNLTLSGGLAKGGDGGGGGGGLGAGGAIFNQGAVVLDAVTLTGNEALGGSGGVSQAGDGGGGIGTDSDSSGDGGGFGPGNFGGAAGGPGNSGGSFNQGGGGGGFLTSDTGGTPNGGGTVSGLGGSGVGPGGQSGDGSGGGGGGSPNGGTGGAFGAGGLDGGGGGGGGVGGGGAGSGGGGGFGGGGGVNGAGGFGGGGGFDTPGGFGGGFGGNCIGGCSSGGGSGMGGAIFNMQGTLSITDSTLVFNTAVHGSGKNNGTSYGAAIFNLSGTVNITFSTLAYNTADAGGAIYNLLDDAATVRNAAVTLDGSIAAEDTANDGTAADDDVVCNVAGTATGDAAAPATVNETSFDLVISNDPQGTCSISGSPLTVNPMLGKTLAANGASKVPYTLALLNDSLAIDAGGSSCPAIDERGVSRPQGSACDIGAYEFVFVSVAPTSLAFGDVALGDSSTARTVSIVNNQSTSISLGTGISGSGFAISTTTCGATLATGKSCTVSVMFTPAALGAVTGTLTLTDSPDAKSPHSIALSGTGEAQTTLTPAGLAFGDVAVGSTSAAKVVTLENHETAAISVGTGISGTGFAITATTCGSTLAAAKTCTVSVTFTPAAVGAVAGTLTLTDSPDTQSPHSIALTGTGEAQTTVTPSSENFGNVVVGSTSAARTIILENHETAAISVSTGITGAGFAISGGTCTSTLAAAKTCTVTVTFKPAANGAVTGTLTLTDSPDSASPHSIALSGAGT